MITPMAASGDVRELLAGYRKRLWRTPWGHETPDTLLSPVCSTETSVRRFESQVLTLFRAHLKVLHAIETGRVPDAAAGYARLERVVRAYYLDWPVLGRGARLDPDTLLSDEVADLLVGRPDVVLTADGPKVVETNLDTAAAGHERPDDLWTIAAELFDPPAELLATGRPLAGLRDYFVELAGDTPHHVYWIMKDDPATRRELDPTIEFLNRDPAVVRHSIHYAGDPLPPPVADRPGYLHRACSIFTVNRDRARFEATLARLAPLADACTVPVGLSPLASKLFIAWLSDPAARPTTLTAEEHDAVDALVPWTRVPALLDGRELDRIRRDRGEYVLKKADSHQAMDVHFGCHLDKDDWTSLLERCRGAPEMVDGAANVWIVQRRVRPREYDLVEYTDVGAVHRRTGLSCCPYLMGGRLRGLETWLLPATPDEDMTKRMHFVPHYIGLTGRT